MGLAMIPSLMAAVIYQEKTALVAFLTASIGLLVVGFVLFLAGEAIPAKLTIRDGFLTVSLCWFLASALGSLPFILSGSIPGFVNAFFETTSGFTTTGSSILANVEALPKSILFWRSFTAWTGGAAILVFAIALMPSLGLSGQKIAMTEAPDSVIKKATSQTFRAVRSLCAVYLAFSVAEALLLCLGGMSLFDSMIHTFGSVSTGGFSDYHDSIGHFDSAYIYLVITIFMLLPAFNFNWYYNALHRGGGSMFKDSELRFYMLLTGILILFIALDLRFSGTDGTTGQSFLDALFQTVSMITTTGFTTADYNFWPTFSKILLFMMMFIGGCSASAGGGIKAVRILLLLRLVARGIATRLHPSAVVIVKLNGRTLPGDTVSGIVNFTFFYTVVLFVFTVFLSLNNYDLITTVSSVAVCLGNVGPGFGPAGPAGSFSIYAPAAKLLLSFLMVCGRLELFAVFTLLIPKFWRHDY